MNTTSSRKSQRGAIAIMAAILLPVMIIMAALAIDLGHLFYVKRHLQKVADLAAVAAAQFLANPAVSAVNVAKQNGFDPGKAGNGYIVTPGYWNPGPGPNAVPGSCPPWDAQCGTPSYFAAGGPNLNAVQVEATQDVPYFFLFGKRTVSAGAVGFNTNAAGFSLASQLLQVDTQQSALLNSILGGLLNTTLNLSAAAYNGLLNTAVNIGDLKESLNVGTVNELLKANLDLPGLYTGILTALNKQGLVNSDAQGALATLLGSGIHVPGGLNVNLGKILNLSSPTDAAAAQANVNVFDLVTAAAMLSNGKHFIQIPNLGINLPGILTLSLGLNVISPPSFAFGPPGRNPDGTWKTQAHTAQVALGLDLTVGQLLGGLVHLPIYLEIAPAQAHLTSLTCAAPQTGNQATIGAQTALATVILGDVPPGALDNTTDPLAIQKAATGPTLVNVLGLVTISMKKPIILPLSPQGWDPSQQGNVGYTDLTFHGKPTQEQTIDSNLLGSGVNTLLNALVAQLADPQSLVVSIVGIQLPLGQIAAMLVNLLLPVLQPVTQLLDAVIAPVLKLLGIQLGQALVTYNSVLCNNAVLVY